LIYEKGFKDKTALLLSVNHAKFRRAVYPGDTLFLHAQGLHFGGRGGKIEAKAIVDDQLAVEAEIGFALRGFEQI
jgi:3-hydroxyacyl-[acyl-carrier-protein] dehydratase